MDLIRHGRQVATLGLAFLLFACVTEPGPDPKTVQRPAFTLAPQETDVLDYSKNPHASTESVDQLVDVHSADPDATQMHDIVGPLLVYYRAKGYFPPNLQDLLLIDPSLKFTNPRTGKAYGYDPEGRSARDISSKILVYDADPMPGSRPGQGVRWCIFWNPPAHSWDPQTAQVMLVSEGVFRTYNLPLPGVLQLQ